MNKICSTIIKRKIDKINWDNFRGILFGFVDSELVWTVERDSEDLLTFKINKLEKSDSMEKITFFGSLDDVKNYCEKHC